MSFSPFISLFLENSKNDDHKYSGHHLTYNIKFKTRIVTWKNVVSLDYLYCGFRYVWINYLWIAMLPTLSRVFNLKWNYYKRDFLQYNSLCWENFKVCAWSEFIYKNDRENFSKIVVRWSRYVESRLLGKFWCNCKDFFKRRIYSYMGKDFIMLTRLFDSYTYVNVSLTNYDFIYLNRHI